MRKFLTASVAVGAAVVATSGTADARVWGYGATLATKLPPNMYPQ